ncbi:MAG TPA: homocysteine S-methyltransferase family protein [Thermoanaerobaculia bacterium]|nr:homocysteine S-methyltransferase family protein [Thermoanaerobaculia bacterium]
MNPEALAARFAERRLLLDAALGTELARRGAPSAPPLWSARAVLERPDLVLAVHRENVAAGADVLTAGTFRTQPALLGAAAREATRRAVALAREAAAERPGVLVAGSLAPVADCWRPDLVPPDGELARLHALHAGALAEAGADLLLLETFGTAREWLAAARAAATTGLAVVACATTREDGALLSGEPLEEAARALLALPSPPAALGVNCVPARRLAASLVCLAAAAPGVPLAAYANTGLPIDEAAGAFAEPISPEEYATVAERWLSLGARLVGGCCGTGAGHVEALASRPGAPTGAPYGK